MPIISLSSQLASAAITPQPGSLTGAPQDSNLRQDFWKSLAFVSLDFGHGITLTVLSSGRLSISFSDEVNLVFELWGRSLWIPRVGRKTSWVDSLQLLGCSAS